MLWPLAPSVPNVPHRLDLGHEPAAAVAEERGHDAEHGVTEPPTFRNSAGSGA